MKQQYQYELFFCGPVLPYRKTEREMLEESMFKRYEVTRDGIVTDKWKNDKEVKITIGKYKSVFINYAGDSKRIKVHRMVAMRYIPNPNNYPEINHKNGIKHDNRVENLEWCTRQMNAYHAKINGFYKQKRKMIA